MVERATEDGYTFPYVVDDGPAVARAYGATCTFHVFVLDASAACAIEGRFDDSGSRNVTSHDLRNALDDIARRAGTSASATTAVRLQPRLRLRERVDRAGGARSASPLSRPVVPDGRPRGGGRAAPG